MRQLHLPSSHENDKMVMKPARHLCAGWNRVCLTRKLLGVMIQEDNLFLGQNLLLF